MPPGRRWVNVRALRCPPGTVIDSFPEVLRRIADSVESFSLAGVSRDPEIRLAIAHVLEGTTIAWEAVWLEVSTDGGTTWSTVSALAPQ